MLEQFPKLEVLKCELGVIEGFFGKSWSWEVRQTYSSLLPKLGYSFYIYAPKDDRYLRRNWAEPWPETQLEQLQALANSCRSTDLAFGIGLSPFEAYRDYSPQTRVKLQSKVALINSSLQPTILCVLFDDMRGDIPGLADRQLQIFEDIASVSSAKRIVMCPTYYTTDPILEKVFGAMPERYLETLGETLDPRVDIFWTGPKVCSTEYPRTHLEWVAQVLRRRPFLWDNYPANDGRRTSPFLHLRAFENRNLELRNLLAGHAVNPMKQPWLSQVPLATLPISYVATEYLPSEVFRRAAERLCGSEFATCLEADISYFQDVGVERLSEEQKRLLRERYSEFKNNPFAQEIIGWLDGQYAFDPDCLTD